MDESRPMPPAVLRACMDSLGYTWRQVARMLQCDDRLVRRWMSGKFPVPDPVADWIERVLAARDAEAAKVPAPGPWSKEPWRHKEPALVVDLATGEAEDDEE